MIKNYKLIEPPLKRHVYETTEKEAQELFEWFIKVIPERLEILKKALKDTDHKPEKLDFSEESLDYLGKWFSKNLHWRRLTEEEIEADKIQYHKVIKKGNIEINLADIVKLPKRDLSFETNSLCWDVGIYFAETLRKNVKGLRWDFVRKPKNDVDYHFPVLTGFGKDGTNRFTPKAIIRTVALKILEKKGGPFLLRDIYNVWKSYAINK